MLATCITFLLKGIEAGPNQSRRMITRLVGSVWAFALLFKVWDIVRSTIWDGYAASDFPILAASRGRANNPPTYMYLPASVSFVTVHGDYSRAQGSEESASLSTFEDVCAPCEQIQNQSSVDVA